MDSTALSDHLYLGRGGGGLARFHHRPHICCFCTQKSPSLPSSPGGMLLPGHILASVFLLGRNLSLQPFTFQLLHVHSDHSSQFISHSCHSHNSFFNVSVPLKFGVIPEGRSCFLHRQTHTDKNSVITCIDSAARLLGSKSWPNYWPPV